MLSFCEAGTKETVQCSEDIRLCGKLVSWHWLCILCPLLVSFFFQLPIALVLVLLALPGPRDALSFSFWFILVLRPSWFSTGLLGFPGSLTLYLFVFPASFFSYSSWHCLVLPIFSYGVPLSCWDCMELLILVSLDILTLLVSYSPPGTPSSFCHSAIEWGLFGNIFGLQHLIYGTGTMDVVGSDLHSERSARTRDS